MAHVNLRSGISSPRGRGERQFCCKPEYHQPSTFWHNYRKVLFYLYRRVINSAIEKAPENPKSKHSKISKSILSLTSLEKWSSQLLYFLRERRLMVFILLRSKKVHLQVWARFSHSLWNMMLKINISPIYFWELCTHTNGIFVYFPEIMELP